MNETQSHKLGASLSYRNCCKSAVVLRFGYCCESLQTFYITSFGDCTCLQHHETTFKTYVQNEMSTLRLSILFRSPILRYSPDYLRLFVASRTCLHYNQESFHHRSKLPLHSLYSLLESVPSAKRK